MQGLMPCLEPYFVMDFPRDWQMCYHVSSKISVFVL